MAHLIYLISASNVRIDLKCANRPQMRTAFSASNVRIHLKCANRPQMCTAFSASNVQNRPQMCESASNVRIGLKCAQPSQPHSHTLPQLHSHRLLWPHSHTLAQSHFHSPLPASVNFSAAASFNCTHLSSFDVKQYHPCLASFHIKQYVPHWCLIWCQTVSAPLVLYLASNSICLIWLHLMLRSIYVIWPHLMFNTIHIIGASFGVKPYLPHWRLIWRQTVKMCTEFSSLIGSETSHDKINYLCLKCAEVVHIWGWFFTFEAESAFFAQNRPQMSKI